MPIHHVRVIRRDERLYVSIDDVVAILRGDINELQKEMLDCLLNPDTKKQPQETAIIATCKQARIDSLNDVVYSLENL